MQRRTSRLIAATETTPLFGDCRSQVDVLPAGQVTRGAYAAAGCHNRPRGFCVSSSPGALASAAVSCAIRESGGFAGPRLWRRCSDQAAEARALRSLSIKPEAGLNCWRRSLASSRVHTSRETPAMIGRILSAFAAQLMPEQAQTAGRDLPQKAEATKEQALGELLAESAASLSLPDAVRSLADVTSTGESTEMVLWLVTSVAAQLTPAQLRLLPQTCDNKRQRSRTQR